MCVPGVQGGGDTILSREGFRQRINKPFVEVSWKLFSSNKMALPLRVFRQRWDARAWLPWRGLHVFSAWSLAGPTAQVREAAPTCDRGVSPYVEAPRGSAPLGKVKELKATWLLAAGVWGVTPPGNLWR